MLLKFILVFRLKTIIVLKHFYEIWSSDLNVYQFLFIALVMIMTLCMLLYDGVFSRKKRIGLGDESRKLEAVAEEEEVEEQRRRSLLSLILLLIRTSRAIACVTRCLTVR